MMILEEIAALLRVYPSTIYRLIRKSSGVAAFKLGSDWRPGDSWPSLADSCSLTHFSTDSRLKHRLNGGASRLLEVA
jgi:hypothetical protein